MNNPLIFNYDNASGNMDESTNVSATLAQNYKDATPEEQLKVLYDVRVREINNLQDEFTTFQAEKTKEISILKNKVTLSEAEIRHLQLQNSELKEILVEKTDVLNKFKQNLLNKDKEIEDLKRVIEELKLEICSYTSTINELQLKQSDNNPFSAGARNFKSEELQKAHQDQIVKLETLLQEQNKKGQVLEKENRRLETELKNLIESKSQIEEENNLTIMALSKKLQQSQQQCRDLFILGEAIKKEGDHFKERLRQFDTNDLCNKSPINKSMDKETMVVHLEKLKRMLLDKEIEIGTLQAKLKFYDSDLDELFEYRKLLKEIYNSEIKPCNNLEHSESLIFMQRQLQSYQQAVEDRNQQILSLKLVNTELQEKIEEMIQQTRTEIQSLSQKYSLPQLETMSNELKNAQKSIAHLKQKLEDSEQERIGLEAQLHNTLEKMKAMENAAISEKEMLEKMIQKLKEDLNTRLLEDDKENEPLKLKYGHVKDQLHQVAERLQKIIPGDNTKADPGIRIIYQLQEKIQKFLKVPNPSKITDKLQKWDNMLSRYLHGVNLNLNGSLRQSKSDLKGSFEDLSNSKTMLEGEKFALEYQLSGLEKKLQVAKKKIDELTQENFVLLQERDIVSKTGKEIEEECCKLKNDLKLLEDSKKEVEQQLDEAQKQIVAAQEEIIKLQRKVNEINSDSAKKTISEALKDVENDLEQSRRENNGAFNFYACVSVTNATRH